MTVVITILAVIAATIMPNVLSESKSREARQFFSKARNLMQEARARSIGDGQTRSIRLDETAGNLIIERADVESGEPVEDRTLRLPEGVTGSAYRVGKTESTSSEWTVKFFGDGKAAGGALALDSNGRVRSLVIEDSGMIRLLDGELPPVAEESWDAGGYEQRV